VEGWITDKPGPYVVKLTKTRDYSYTYSDTVLYEKGAKVRITDDTGYSVDLREVSEGIYITDSADLRGTVGRSYTLHFETRDGRFFASQAEPLLEVPMIDSVYYSLDFSRLDQNDNPFLEGYIQFNDPSEDNYYLIYQQEVLTDGKVFETTRDPISDKYFNGKTAKVHVLGPFNPDVRAVSTLQRFQILSLSKDAYNFWSLVDLQTQEIGSPYDPPPTPIIGNIRNVNDGKDYALGYFGASSVDEAEILVKSR
jgi:hypothetical protein